MNKGLVRIILMGCILTTGLVPAVKAVSFTNDLPDSIGIWDISGEYSEDLGDGIYMDYIVNQDGKGKLIGYGYAEYHDWEIDLYMDFTVKGKIKSKNGVYSVMQKLSAKGVAYSPIYDETVSFKASVIMKAEIDTVGKSMSGTVTVKVMGMKETDYFYETIDDPSMDGSVTVYTDVDDVNGKLLGVAQIELSNGRIVYCGVKAKENSKDSTLKITAKGEKEDPNSKGSKVRMVLDPDGMLQILKGRICGQKIQWEVE